MGTNTDTNTDKINEEEAPLVWVPMAADNLLVTSLKDMAGLFAHVVTKEIKQLEKDILLAKKVFHGR